MSTLADFQTEGFVRAAFAKAVALPDNFMFYAAGWQGDMTSDACIMKLDGCVFREATCGPRKGELCIKVKGTKRSVYLSASDVRAAQ